MNKGLVKVVVVGPESYVGGINVHINRLLFLLGDNVEFDFIDDAPVQLAKRPARSIRKPSSFLRILGMLFQADIVHIHSGNWLLRIFLILASILLSSKVVVTLHSYRLSGLRKKISDAVMRVADEIICVNKDIKDSLGIDRAYVKEAFIPPVDTKDSSLPNEINRFIDSVPESMLLCANAYRLIRHDGKDLYGLAQCLSVARKAKLENEKIAIVFVVGTVMASDDLYYSAKKIIKDEELEAYISLYPHSLNFLALMRRSDIVLRPTITDGDALTIREAIFLGKPVIASDVVARPAGTTLYRSENVDELYAAIRKVASKLSSGQYMSGQAEPCRADEYKRFYLEVYRKCIS